MAEPNSTADLLRRIRQGSGKLQETLVYPEDLGSVETTDYLNYMAIYVWERTNTAKLGDNNSGLNILGAKNLDETTGKVSEDANGTIKAPASSEVYSEAGAQAGLENFTLDIPRAINKTNILLYLPPGIVSQHSAAWNAVETKAVMSTAKAADAAAQRAKQEAEIVVDETTKGNPTKAISSALAGAFGGAVDAATSSGLLLTASEIAGGVGIQGVTEIATSKIGQILNPYTEVVFSGISNRTFSFQFKFLPKSHSEAVTVDSIIRMLKYHSLPSIQPKDITINYPSEFQIEFWSTKKQVDANGNVTYSTDKNKRLFKMDMLACTGVDVNYTPTGNLRQFSDGYITEIDLTISFTEMTIQTRGKISQEFPTE